MSERERLGERERERENGIGGGGGGGLGVRAVRAFSYLCQVFLSPSLKLSVVLRFRLKCHSPSRLLLCSECC